MSLPPIGSLRRDARFTPRDFEVMRSVARLQLVSTSTLGAGLFADLRGAQRRLHTLRVRGWLESRSPAAAGYQPKPEHVYWYLTSMGQRVVGELFPDEAGSESPRAARGACLRFFEHRRALNELYMWLVCDSGVTSDWKAAAERARERASAFRWFRDGTVRFRTSVVRGGRQEDVEVVPDATIETSNARVFVEVDRSTESAAHCRRVVERYVKLVETGVVERELGPREFTEVLYVATKGSRRAAGLEKQFGRVKTGRLRVRAKTHLEAGDCLRAELLGEAPEAEGEARASRSSVIQDDLAQVFEVAVAAVESHGGGAGQRDAWNAVLREVYERHWGEVDARAG